MDHPNCCRFFKLAPAFDTDEDVQQQIDQGNAPVGILDMIQQHEDLLFKRYEQDMAAMKTIRGAVLNMKGIQETKEDPVL